VLAHVTNCVDTANMRARVFALLADAGLVGCAILGDETFRVTMRGFAVEARFTTTDHARPADLADGVRTATIRVTLVSRGTTS